MAEKDNAIISAAKQPGMPITSLRWRPNHSTTKKQPVLVSTCADGTVSHWHPGTGKDYSILSMGYEWEG